MTSNEYGELDPDGRMKCECCGVVNQTVYDITSMAPYPVKPEFLCDDCAEKRWYAQQEKLIEET